MQRFKVHSHSQAVFPYSQESTTGSFQYHTTPTICGLLNPTLVGSTPYLSLSMDGIRLGDIRFAKIQITLRMRTVSITVLERWIENGKCNPDRKAEGKYSRSTAILVILNPNNQGTGLKCVSVGLIV